MGVDTGRAGEFEMALKIGVPPLAPPFLGLRNIRLHDPEDHPRHHRLRGGGQANHPADVEQRHGTGRGRQHRAVPFQVEIGG